MADTVIISNTTISAIDSVTVLYTASAAGLGTVINAFTATNSSASSVTYKAYIYDITGSVVSAVIPQTIVVKDRFHAGASIVNQVVPAGGTIRVENSAANGLNFYCSGREQ